MLSMYSKCPAKRRWGIHHANILPGKGPFAAQTPQIMHSAQILPCMIAPAERILLGESCRARRIPLDESYRARRIPLGESCRAIGPVARIPPRFAANDSVVILGSLHAGQDAPSPFQPLDPKTPKLKTLNPNHQGNTQSSSAFSHRRFEGWQPRFQWGRIQQLPLHQAPGAYRQAPTQEPSRE